VDELFDNVFWVWEIVCYISVLLCKFQNLFYAQGLVLRSVDVSNVTYLYGFFLLGQEILHPVDVNGFYGWQIQADVDCKKATIVYISATD